jgi:hypothetical protein
MAQPSSNYRDLTAGFVQHVVNFPTQPGAQGRTELPAPSARRPAAGQRVRVRTHAIGQGVVLEVAGRLSDVVEDLDRAIQLALAGGPRGVVCDLSGVLEGAEPGAVEVLATAGRHVRDWSAIPLAVVCPDPLVREALIAHPLGRHLIVTASMLPAVSAVLATPVPAVEWLRLAPHPTAPRASRDFVTRTLLAWGLGALIPSATLVVSELVTNSTIHAGTDIEVSIAWDQADLRLGVRDNSPDLRRKRHSQFDVHGRGLLVVAGLCRAVGVLPSAYGGKVIWAVLDTSAASSGPSPRSPEGEPPTTAQEPSVLTSACSPTGLPSAPSPARAQSKNRLRPPPGDLPTSGVDRCPETKEAVQVVRFLRLMPKKGRSESLRSAVVT